MALIIDANMPTKGCADCPLKRYWEGNPWTYGYACFITSQDIDKEIKEGFFHESCPILCEIPDKHGELIDRMSAIHRIEAEFDSDIAQDIIGLLLAEPTVVEATE